MPRFHLEKLSNSAKQKVFETFTDYARYQKLFPETFPSVRILSTRNEVSVVEEHMVLGGRELVMMTKHVVDAENKHEIFVIGGDAKGTHIVEIFEPVKNGTRVIIDVDFKLKGKMKIASIFSKINIEKEYSKLIEEFLNYLSLV